MQTEEAKMRQNSPVLRDVHEVLELLSSDNEPILKCGQEVSEMRIHISSESVLE